MRVSIHHGGIGTVHAAVRAGTVSVVIPFIADQPYWGGTASPPLAAVRVLESLA